MLRRQPLPRLWLMTDERMGEALWRALDRLPRGGGVIFRHYATEPDARRELFKRVRRVTRKRGLVLVLGGTPRQAAAWRADGAHSRSRHVQTARPLLRTAPAHDARELHAAAADAVLLSPIFVTRSHPEARVLGPLRFGLIVPRRKPGSSSMRGAGSRRSPGNKAVKDTQVIALGGMTARRFRRLSALGAYGWAAIDAWA